MFQIKQISHDTYKFGNWRGMCALMHKEIMRFARVYMQTIVAPVITTLLFYVIFALAFGGLERDINGVPFLDFLAPGLIMMAMVQNAFANTSSSWIIAKIQGNIIDFLMPPLSPLEMFIGNAVGAMARGIAVGFFTWLAMEAFLHIPVNNPALIIAYAILGTMMLGSLGMIAGIWAEKFDHIAVVTNFVVTPLAFLSGTFYSMETLPQLWQGIAAFNPFYYMIDGVRTGFLGVGDTNIALGLSVLGVINALLASIVILMLRSGYKIKP